MYWEVNGTWDGFLELIAMVAMLLKLSNKIVGKDVGTTKGVEVIWFNISILYTFYLTLVYTYYCIIYN